MGKSLVILGADFSANGIDMPIFGISDEQFLAGYAQWNLSVLGFALSSQEALRNITLTGIKINVSAAGTLKIYKTTNLSAADASGMVEIATITATETGLQQIDFSNPIQLANNEFLVLGKYDDSTTFKAYYDPSGTSSAIIQWFYVSVGNSGHETYGSESLNVDFY